MTSERLPLSAIVIKDRLRGATEDIDLLCESLTRFGGEAKGMLQPIIVDQDNVLQDGFNRFTAAQTLGWTTVPIYRRTSLSEAEYFEVEFETNFRRTQWTWQETVQGVVRVHRTRKREAVLAGAEWTQAMTGELLGGYSDSYVSNCLLLAPHLADPDMASCTSITDGVRVLYQRRLDEGNRLLAAMTKMVPNLAPLTTTEALAIQTSVGSLAFDPNEDCDGCQGSGHVANNAFCPICKGTGKKKLYDAEGNAIKVVEKVEPNFVVSLSKTLFLGDSIRTVLPSWPSACVDHIITDPPYGIDTDNMEQIEGIERVAATHDVAENLSLFSLMFHQFFRVLKDRGFCILWCDEEHRHTLKTLALAAGFKVQRWSHVWVKTSACSNGAAQYNETKATEIALVCRKENTILPHQSPNNFTICPNTADRTSNPFAKPFELWEDLINRFTFQGQLILDPFAGEGSFPLASLRLNRPVIAVEKDPIHFNQMVESVKEHWRGVNEKVKFV